MSNYIGIDVSKRTLDVYRSSDGQHFSVTNDKKGIKKLVKESRDSHVVLEATGVYHRDTVRTLQQANIPVSVMNPRRVRDFARATGVLAKTDKLDAKVIADFAVILTPEPTPQSSPEREKLRAFTSRREQMVEMITVETNRIQVSPKEVVPSIRKVIQILKAQVKEIEKQIASLVETHFSEQAKLLTSVPGVGKVLCSVLIADLPELGHANKQEIAALAGLAPFNRDSGSSSRKRSIHAGRASVRKVLYMASVASVRCNSVLKRAYLAYRAAGKPAKVALIAIARKLLVILNTIMKTNAPWRYDLSPTAA